MQPRVGEGGRWSAMEACTRPFGVFLLLLQIMDPPISWWGHSPPTNVAQVWFPHSPSYVGNEFVLGSHPCSKRFSLGTPVFPSPQKPTFPNANSTLEVSPISILCKIPLTPKESDFFFLFMRVTIIIHDLSVCIVIVLQSNFLVWFIILLYGTWVNSILFCQGKLQRFLYALPKEMIKRLHR